ncbi:tetratricopeptide repeat protein [bacterium]|nr:tetratricopeptide repeat protein [bacterium]
MPQTPRIFRVFVSSTFSDLKVERNVLQARVYPELQKLARENGCRFQAVDLRWGISSEAALDQQTMKICLSEIDRCQTISPKPNFLILVGNRYGWRPLPYEINKVEFDQVLQQIKFTDIREKLDYWYILDKNAIPPTYVLQPRTGIYEDGDVWGKEEALLQAALESAAERADLDDLALRKYQTSATEQEIYKGLFTVPDPQEHIFCFARDIRNLPQVDEAKEFLDLKDGAADPQALENARDLKRKLAALLGDNFYRYTVDWLNQGPDLSHLNQFCDDVVDCLSKVMLKEIDSLAQVDVLDQEIAAQFQFATESAAHFMGWEAPLGEVQRYLDSGSNQPLIICAPSGMGKSTLMAKLFVDVVNAIKGGTIARFIGATPDSSNPRALLRGICRQLVRTMGGDDSKVATRYDKLVRELPRYLSDAGNLRPVLLLVDAVNQLVEERPGMRFTWLPTHLPSNVKCILTTTPEDSFEFVRKKLPDSEVLYLDRMSDFQGEELLSAWLKSAHRELTLDQRQEVMRMFANAGSPLFLRLAFDEAKEWHSYDELPTYPEGRVGLGSDILQLFKDFLWRLSKEDRHGALLVEKSLSYLACAKNGLSEGELYDILADDKVVIDDFLRRSPKSPVVTRLPGVVFSRLLFDLQPYLAETVADQTMVLRLNHSRWVDLIDELYLQGDKRNKIHAALADFFEKREASVRKVAELPWHLARINSWDRLADALTDWLFFEVAWDHDHVAVERFWADIEAHSDLHKTEVYEDVIERHPDNRRYLGHVAELMMYTYCHKEAEKLQEYVLALQRPDSNPIDLAKQLNARGVSLKNIGDLESAMAAYKEAETISRNLHDRRILATVLGNEGNVLRRQGELDQAKEVLKEAVDLARELDDVHISFPCLNSLGLLYYENDENEEALAIFNELETVGRTFGEPLMLAAALGNKCTLMERLWEGTPEELIEIRSEEVLIYRDHGVQPKLIEALEQKQKLIRRQIRRLQRRPIDKFDEETKRHLLNCYLDEEVICKELGDIKGEVLAQSGRAVVLAALGQPGSTALINQALDRVLRENQLDVVDRIQADLALVSDLSKRVRKG